MKTVRRLFSSQRGVTLIELLVVVVILGIIAAVVIPMVTSNQETSYVNTNLQNQAILNEAVQRYAIDHGGKFPTVDANGSKVSTISIEKLTTSQNGKGPYIQGIPVIYRTDGTTKEHVINQYPRWFVNSQGKVVIRPNEASLQDNQLIENGRVNP